MLGYIGSASSNDDQPSLFTIGGAIDNSYGGNHPDPPTGDAALDKTEDAVIEAAVGTGFRASDWLALGELLCGSCIGLSKGVLHVGIFSPQLGGDPDPLPAHVLVLLATRRSTS